MRPIVNPTKDLARVLNYILKPADILRWNAEQVKEFNSLRGLKLSECYGEIRSFKAESEDDLTEEVEDEQLFVGAPCTASATRSPQDLPIMEFMTQRSWPYSAIQASGCRASTLTPHLKPCRTLLTGSEGQETYSNSEPRGRMSAIIPPTRKVLRLGHKQAAG